MTKGFVGLIISHRHRFIFVKTVKTAGTSIEWYLNQHLGRDDVATPVYPPVDGHVPRNDRGWFNPVPEILARGPRAARRAGLDLMQRRRYYNHLEAYRIRARVGATVWDDYFTFCVERNPWDKDVSYYSMQKARSAEPLEWDDFVAGSDHCRNLMFYMDPRDPMKVIVDRVLRYESLDEELAEVFAQLDVPFHGQLAERAKSEHATGRKPYSDWYNDAQRDRIAEVFADEIAMHGYVFGGVEGIPPGVS